MAELEHEETPINDISEFPNVLKEAWIKETSSEEWSEQCPELN